MREIQLGGVKKQAPEPLLRERAVTLVVAVLLVSGDREPQVRQVDADLVGAAREQVRRKQREVAKAAFQTNYRLRLAPLAMHAHTPLARSRQVLLQRQVDSALLLAPSS